MFLIEMDDMKSNKQAIYLKCVSIIDERIEGLKNSIDTLLDDLGSEMKSSAGDKHETSRAMMQLEQEKLTHQLTEAENQKTILEKINPKQITQRITTGSLVFTQINTLFFAIAIGKINVGGIDVMALSIQSPIGVELKGKAKGDVVNFNGRQVEILEVC